MVCPRYMVFDDALQDRTLGWTADQFAEALRSPRAAIGVPVVRQHSVGSTSPMADFRFADALAANATPCPKWSTTSSTAS